LVVVHSVVVGFTFMTEKNAETIGLLDTQLQETSDYLLSKYSEDLKS
jgi:hypothetical protein